MRHYGNKANVPVPSEAAGSPNRAPRVLLKWGPFSTR